MKLINKLITGYHGRLGGLLGDLAIFGMIAWTLYAYHDVIPANFKLFVSDVTSLFS